MMIGKIKHQQPLVDSSTQQRIRPPMPPPPPNSIIQRTQSGSLYIPTDGHMNLKNEYNTIRTLKKNSMDIQMYSSSLENTYHEPQHILGPQHSNNNNIYNSNSGNSGGSTSNATFNSMSNASNAPFVGPNGSSMNSFSTFNRFGSGVAPYTAGQTNGSTLCVGTGSNLSNFTTTFGGIRGSILHHHLSMGGTSGVALAGSSSKNMFCRFAGQTQHACLKFFCGESLANGCWKAATLFFMISTIFLFTILLIMMKNQFNTDNHLPCHSPSTLMDDLKNELKHKQPHQLNAMINNHNYLFNNNKRMKLNTSIMDQNLLSTLSNKLASNIKYYSSSNGQSSNLPISNADNFERLHLERTYFKLVNAFNVWNFQLELRNSALLRFNYTFDQNTLRRTNFSLSLYAARNRFPTRLKYDFIELIDYHHNASSPFTSLNELNQRNQAFEANLDSNLLFSNFINQTNGFSSIESIVRTRLTNSDQLETRQFMHYLDAGIWYITIHNNQNLPIDLAFQAQSSGTCQVLCSNNGRYMHGECACNAGFKGKECELSLNECEVSDCNGHGYCMDGQCHCFPGYKGENCKEIDCLDSFCSGHGQCINGLCVCHKGYRSADCSEKVDDICGNLQVICSAHGHLNKKNSCVCDPGWTGTDCSIEICSLDCGSHGTCQNGVCVCLEGFSGSKCQHKKCSIHCTQHGQCLNNGTCLCEKGFNGKHCTLDGCANNCNDQGECVKQEDLWKCKCSLSAVGEFCEIPIENNCDDKLDNDNDGLVDCADSECCSSQACVNSPFCLSSLDPLDILLRKQPPALTATFFQRIQFLIEEDSVQSYAHKNAFNESRASVICGKVVDHHGNGLVGVRVGLANQQPTVGFVVTRRNGHFDLMVNGGGAVVLHLLRDPFQPMQHSVNVPWNSIIVLDRLEMQLQSNTFSNNNLHGFLHQKKLNSTSALSAGRTKLLHFNNPTQTMTTTAKLSTSLCLDHNYEKMRFIVLNEKCFNSICVNDLGGNNLPVQNNFNSLNHQPTKTVNLNLSAYKNFLSDTAYNLQSLTASSRFESSYERLSLVEETIKIQGTDLNLVYSSNHADGYLVLIRLQLTPFKIPPSLLFVHVNIKIEGNLIEKRLEAEPNLIYNYSWDKRNIYRQKVYGLTNAFVNIGYEYLNCDQVIWETKLVHVRANDLPTTEVGGLFNLDIHHRYNLQQGILQKGNGENLYLNQLNPMMISTILGDGNQRPLHCSYCNGDLNFIHSMNGQINNYNNEAHKRLLFPVALAASNDGCIYVGDFNLIRKINLRTGKITTIVELNSSQAPYKYHLAVSPADNRLYFTNPEKYQIFVARTTNLEESQNDEFDLRENLDLVAGSGIKCLPGDKTHCGDRKPAKLAKLSYPKALTINLMNEIFIADGTNIRYIDTQGIIHTLIGDNYGKSHWHSFPCNSNSQSIAKINLRWPIGLAINPIDNHLYILDNHIVFKLTNDKRLQIIAGRPTHCDKHIDAENQFDQFQADVRTNEQTNLTNLFNSDNQNNWEPATSIYLETPQAIAFTNQGNLLVAESDSQTINRVRIVLDHKNHQLIGDFVGHHQNTCNCFDKGCSCFDRELNVAINAKMSTISAITVTPNGDIIIADQGNLRIRRVNQNNLPQPSNSNGDYEILSSATNEIYVFNKYGQHMQTKSSLSKKLIYSFEYNVNNSFGKLNSVTELENNKKLNFLRDHQNQVKMIESNSDSNLKINLSVNKLRLLSEVNFNNENTIKFDYYRNTGLLQSRIDKLGSNIEHSVTYEYDEFGRLINKNEN